MNFFTMDTDITQEESDNQPKQLPEMTTEVGSLTRCDGSAIFNQGDSNVIVAIYGPAEVRMNKEQIDKATMEVVYKPKTGLPGCAEKIIENFVRNTCETAVMMSAYPRTSVNIIIQEVQSHGSFLSCCVNASCLALLDSGISMNCLVAAITCAIDNDGKIHIDPNDTIENEATAILTFVFDNKDINVVSVKSDGVFTPEQFHECMILAKESSKGVFRYYKETMEKKLSKLVKTG